MIIIPLHVPLLYFDFFIFPQGVILIIHLLETLVEVHNLSVDNPFALCAELGFMLYFGLRVEETLYRFLIGAGATTQAVLTKQCFVLDYPQGGSARDHCLHCASSKILNDQAKF